MAHRAIGAVTSKDVGDAEAAAPPARVSPADSAVLASSGITLNLSPAGLRLIVVPVSSWRQLSRWYWAAILPAAAAVWLATEALGLNGGGLQPDLWPPVVEFACIALAIAGHAVWRVRHRLVIDVTRDELAVSVVNLAGAGDRAAWPRRDVRDVRLNPHNGKLQLRISGRDPLEYRISRDRQAVRAAAEAVRQAVFFGAFAAPVGGAAGAVRPPRYRRWIGNAVAAAGAATALVGLGLLVFGNAVGAMLIALAVLVLAVTFGLTYGTQEKEFFT